MIFTAPINKMSNWLMFDIILIISYLSEDVILDYERPHQIKFIYSNVKTIYFNCITIYTSLLFVSKTTIFCEFFSSYFLQFLFNEKYFKTDLYLLLFTFKCCSGFNCRATSATLWNEPNLHLHRWYISGCESIYEPRHVHFSGKTIISSIF